MSLINVIAGFASRAGSASPIDPPQPPENYIKNMRLMPVPAGAGYRSFGFCMKVGGKMVLIYHKGESVLYNNVMTYPHLYKGDTAQKSVDIATGAWGPETIIDTEVGRDISDVYGCPISAGKYLYTSSLSPENIKDLAVGVPPSNSGIPAAVFIRIADDETLSWGPRRYLLTDAGAINAPTALHSGTIFGKVKAGATAGEYFAAYLNFNYAGTAPNECYCVRTTDNWLTWTFTPIWSAAGKSETDIAYLGNGKLCAVQRTDQSDEMNIFYSSDSGATWVPGYSILYDFIDHGMATIIHLFMRNGLLDLWHVNRGTGFLCVSKGNDPANFFGVSNPTFNASELYYRVNVNTEEMYHDGTGDNSGNPTLGYQSVEDAGNGKYFVMCGKEKGFNAQIYYTFDDLVTDPAGVPDAPGFVDAPARYMATTSARVSIAGLTNEQLQNTRWFEIQIATDAGFTSFPSIRYNAPNDSAFFKGATTTPQRFISQAINLYVLTTATTYYVRARAVNNAGTSAWTVGSFTTL